MTCTLKFIIYSVIHVRLFTSNNRLFSKYPSSLFLYRVSTVFNCQEMNNNTELFEIQYPFT